MRNLGDVYLVVTQADRQTAQFNSPPHFHARLLGATTLHHSDGEHKTHFQFS
jgi:hypothetical protein